MNIIFVCQYTSFIHEDIEAATSGALQETVFLKISQNSQENACARVSFLIKLQASAWHSCFPVSFAKFLSTPF